jgi:SAM-dependent methyltransferase
MNLSESQWLGQQLARIPDGDLFPLLNVGSSTLEFRTQTQPYIDQNIFAPLRARQGKVVHLDIKYAHGVDMVADLLGSDFPERIAEIQVRSVMICNLLEHVTDRQKICQILLRIVPPGGYLFVTGPHQYPYHRDPIDTMFRPTIEEMCAHFPHTQIIDSAIIDSGNWRQWNSAERGRPLWRMILRLFIPFYRPTKWYELLREAPYIFKPISAFALVLRKNVDMP